MPRNVSEETIKLMQSLYFDEEVPLSVAEIARKAEVSYMTAYGYTRAKDRGFESLHEYEKHLAKQKGFSSLQEYKEHLARKKGFASRHKYEEHLAIEKGFTSLQEYKEHLAKKRQQRPENQALSALIKRGLKEIGRNQSWLAKQISRTRQSVSLYAQGKIIPSDDVLKKLYSALGLEYQTLDDLLEKDLEEI